MKVIDILKTACQLTGNEDLISKIESTEIGDNDQSIINNLLSCLNLVINEVCCEYMPILKEEFVEPKNFKIEYSSLGEKPLEIYYVKDIFGRNLKYKKYNDYLMIFAPKAIITYSTQPKEVAISDNIEEIKLPERILAYGVAKEFFISNSLSSEANVWNEKFQASLQNMLRRKSNVILPKRRWC